MITKRTKILLGVLVIVAIGAYAYLYWWSKTPEHGFFDNLPPIVRDASDSAAKAVIRTQTPGQVAAPVNPGTEGTPTIPSTSYRTFENTEFSFSFAYPDNWSVSQTKTGEDTVVCLRTEGGTGDCLITVTLVQQSVNDSMDTALEAYRAEFRKGRIAESTRRIGGQEATLLKVSGYPAGEEDSSRAAVFMKDELVYSIEAAAGQQDIFDRVADSFRFQD